MERPQQQRNRAVAILLAVVFFVFTAFFFIFFQQDLIALLQETWSHGATKNNPYVTTIIVAIILFVLHRLVKAITHLSGRWEAFTWLPSYLLLGLSTAVDSNTLAFNIKFWPVVLGACLLVMLIVCWLSKIWMPDKRTAFSNLFMPSLATTLISMLLCMQFANHDAAFHQELAAYRHASHDDAPRVAAVGQHSLETTQALTALRNVALAREGRAGDELFHYPQPYGTNGLDINRFTRQNTSFGATTFYTFLGAEPYGGETTAAFIQRQYQLNDTPLFKELYAASLLLDCRLDEFVSAFPPPSAAAAAAASPRHWREAWMLHKALNKSSLLNYTDDELQPQLDEFLTALRNSHTDQRTTLNALFLDYGETFWHYYAQQKLKI